MATEKDLGSGDVVVAVQDEILQPLLQSQQGSKADLADQCTHHEPIPMWMLLTTGILVLGSFQFGVCLGFSAPAQSGIRDELGLSLSEYAIFGSILTIGGMFGAISCGAIADSIGRKRAMCLSSLFCLVGWLAIYFAKCAYTLYLGRLCTGYGVGILSYVVPVFISEISPKNIRGGLTTINQVMNSAGGSAPYIVEAFITWRSLVFIGVFPCILLLVGLFFIPESPRWLAKVGKRKEFRAALQKLRGEDADISKEASEIEEYLQIVESLPKAKIQDLFGRKYIRSVIVGVGLMVFQQLSGINGILFYAGQIFVQAGFPSGNMGTFLMGCVQVPMTTACAILMDKSGRRPLILISAFGAFLGTFLAGVSFCLKEQGLFIDWVQMVTLAGILIFVGSFCLGLGAVPWVMMSEIFAVNIKGTGGSLVTLVNWLATWLISYTFSFMMAWSSSGTFFLYSAISALTILFVIKVVPETKGRTLEEIQASLSR